jgi:hypothetical protein
MAVALEPLTFDRFKGIREFNGVNYGGEISAITCKNVELVQTEIGNNTGIKTMAGNKSAYTLPTGYSIKGVFASEQDNVIYRFIYAETELKGTLFYININSEPTVLADDLTVTGKCNGLTMSATAYDVFVFTNGEEAYTVCFTSDQTYGEQIKPLNFMYGWKNGTTYKYTITRNPAANDYVYEANGDKTTTQITSVTTTSEGVVTSINVGGTNYSYDGKKTKTDKDGGKQYIKFLAMTVWNGRLVVATDYGVRASHDNNIYKWNDTNINDASSWYINYTEKVTALYAYTGGLFIFTDDNTDFINGNPNNSSSMLVTTAGVGCHSFDSIVKHDTYLFFYSNIQKNIYMIQNIDNGQTRPTGPLAKEVQSAFKDVKNIKFYSCIYDNKNEIWLLITDNRNRETTYIYNYNLGEWTTRTGMAYNCVCQINNSILTALGNKVYYEFMNDNFDGSYQAAEYQTCFINAGSNTNLKKQKTPLLIVLNDSYVNDFYVQLIINGKPKKAKHVKLGGGNSGVYGSTEEDLDAIPDNQVYGSIETEEACAIYGQYNPYSKKVVEISTPQTWYTMSIRIFTEGNGAGEGFYIYSMELKNMKAKLKTRGR